MKFTTPSKLKEKLNEEITLQNWIKERDQYIHEQELGTKCWSRHAVFLAEVEELDTHPRSQVAFKTIVTSYSMYKFSVSSNSHSF